MRTSYLAQIVNLAASAILLIMVLAYLAPGQYLQWVLFQTFAGALIQLDQSLAAVSTRHMARARAAGGPDALARAAGAVRRLYRRFGLIGSAAMFLVGYCYFATASAGRFGPRWPLEWAIFAAAFAIWYSAMWRSGLLVAREQPARVARVAIAVRAGNALFAVAALLAGAAILGLAVSTLAAFAIGAGLFFFVTRKIPVGPPEADDPPLMLRHMLLHATYILAAYLLYRAGLMLSAATSDDTGRQAGFGLLLQIMGLTSMVAAVPLTMRVAPLVAALSAGDTADIRRELGHLAAYANIVFVGAILGLALFAGPIALLLPSHGASLPHAIEILALGAAFWIELNLLILVNALLAARAFGFVARYMLSASIAVAASLAAHLAGAPFYIAFVLVPALVQSAIAAPLLLALVRRTLGVSPRAYGGATIAHAGQILRHPIRIGLALR